MKSHAHYLLVPGVVALVSISEISSAHASHQFAYHKSVQFVQDTMQSQNRMENKTIAHYSTIPLSESSSVKSIKHVNGPAKLFHAITHVISAGIHVISHTFRTASTFLAHVAKKSYTLAKEGLIATARFGIATAKFVSDAANSIVNAPGLVTNFLKLFFRNLNPPALISPSAEVLAHSAGKIPVILVQGTFGNSTSMLDYYKQLEKAGIPAYSPTLGKGGSLLGLVFPMIDGLNTIASSTEQLSQLIGKVQKETGAPKVDIVAFSEGGLVTKNYMVHDAKNNVQAVVNLSGTVHGMTFNGIENYIFAFPKPIQKIINFTLSSLMGPGIVDQEEPSPMVQNLDKYPDTKAGVHYLDIGTRNDTIATPYQTTFLKPVPGADVTNIEVHSIPGVKRNFNHLQNLLDPALVNTVVNYIQQKGEPTKGLETHLEQISSPPSVSLLN